MRLWIKINIIVLMSLFLVGAVVVAQQQTCPEIVQAALDATNEQCSSTGRNQACYGNVNLDATPQTGIGNFNFDAPGDMVAVSAVESLSLSSSIEEEGAWGVALMRLQANVPESLPGQNVTFLLFGAVQITNGVESNTEPVTFDVMALAAINVYTEPSADSSPVSDLLEGDLMTAVGRNAQGDWMQVSESGVSGWVAAAEVEADGDINTLSIINPAVVGLTPMQAFYFQSGISDAPCAEAPDSGILVQTPEGVQQIEFTVNDVNIRLGSTAYLQAQPGGEMTTSVVEGEAIVEAGGASVVVPEGNQVSVPLDAQGRAAGAPSQPQPYDGAQMAVLPIRILPRTIAIAAAISEGTAEAPSGGGVMLTAGQWMWTAGTPSAEGCPAGMIEFVVTDFTPAGPFQLPGGEFSWQIFYDAAYGLSVPPESVFSSLEPNTYIMEIPLDQFSWQYEARVINSERVEGQFVANLEGCTLLLPFELTRIGD